MFERLRESRWFYVVLSILLAVMFWLYVRAVMDPDIQPNHHCQHNGQHDIEPTTLSQTLKHPGHPPYGSGSPAGRSRSGCRASPPRRPRPR